MEGLWESLFHVGTCAREGVPEYYYNLLLRYVCHSIGVSVLVKNRGETARGVWTVFAVERKMPAVRRA